MRELTLSKLAEIMDGHLYPEEMGHIVATGVSIDSRKVKPGDIFFALRGSRFDGQSFIGDATTMGARCAVVDSPPTEELNLPYIMVKDCIKGLGDIAAFHRENFRASVIGVTGSLGKSTTKELIGRILKKNYRTVVAEKSFNNFIGLPLTLLRVSSDTEYVVTEMGINRKGEMDRLIEIASPDFAVVTSIAPVHTEGLGDLIGVAEEKLKLLYSLPPNSTAFLNGDDTNLRNLKRTPFCEVVYYGLGDINRVRGEVVEWGWDGIRFRVKSDEFKLPLLGKFWVYSALAAYAVGEHFGVPVDVMREIFHSFQPMPGRMEVRKVGEVTIVDDSYNANPVSMKQVLGTVSELPANRRFAFLGDMFELGHWAEQAHKDVGSYVVQKGYDFAAFIGPLSEYGFKQANSGSSGTVKHYREIDDLLESLDRIQFEAGDVVVVKGSRAMGMEKVVNKLMEVV